MVNSTVRLRILLPIVFLAGLSVCCTLSPAESALVQGNYAFARGEYQDATVQYLAALEKGGGIQEWVKYNLGNVYYSAGEVEAAMAMWQAAALTRDPRLLFAVNYNRASAYYHQGDFQQAFLLFRAALLLQPDNRDAKLNLELAQRKVQAEELIPVSKGSPSGPAASPLVQVSTFDESRLFDYVKNKEVVRWQKKENPGILTQGGAW